MKSMYTWICEYSDEKERMDSPLKRLQRENELCPFNSKQAWMTVYLWKRLFMWHLVSWIHKVAGTSNANRQHQKEGGNGLQSTSHNPCLYGLPAETGSRVACREQDAPTKHLSFRSHSAPIIPPQANETEWTSLSNIWFSLEMLLYILRASGQLFKCSGSS